MYKRHIHGMSTSREIIPIAHNCAVWAAALSHTLPYIQYRIWCCFGTLKTPSAEIGKFSPVYACRKRFTSVDSKTVEIGGGQVAERPRCLDNKKHVLAPWGGTPGAISPVFLVCVRTVARHLHSRFHPHKFQFGVVITGKRIHEAPK